MNEADDDALLWTRKKFNERHDDTAYGFFNARVVV